MTTYILDTSVAVAWYLPEAFAPAARDWQEKALANAVDFMAPPLHIVEFANVLRTYVRRGELTRDLAEEIYAIHMEAPVMIVAPPQEILLQRALDYEATAYDAAYIALCLEHRVPLLTAERSTTPWVVRLGDLAYTIA